MYNLEKEKPADIQHFTNALTILLDKRLLITSAYIVPFDQLVGVRKEMYANFNDYINYVHDLIDNYTMPHVFVGDFNPHSVS
jgi:hypothetical protein